MKALSGLDGVFLHVETAQTPMHVASLHLLDLPAGYSGDFHADLQRQVRRRLKAAPVLARKLASMPLQFANPVWVEDDRMDLDYHVQRLTLAAPGTREQLEDLVGRLHSEPLDRSRPLWRMAVIDGLQSGQAACYIQIHHAMLDGQAGVMLAQALFDPTPKTRTLPRATGHPEAGPGVLARAAAALKHDARQYIKLVQHLPGAVRTVVGLFDATSGNARGKLGQNFSFGPRTPLNVPITAERGFAGVSIPLEPLRQLAGMHEAKLNDIVLALCSGALRRYLSRHGGIPKEPLIATMPISLREAGNAEYTTQAMLALVNLNTHIADPVGRLRAIRDASGAIKGLAQRARGMIPTDFPSLGVPWLLQGVAALYGRSSIVKALPVFANVVISNVPGPPLPLYVAGARMTDYWPLSIVEHGVGLNITVMSYAGALGFGFTTARCAVPDARELSMSLLAALDELTSRGARAGGQMACARSRPPANQRHAQALSALWASAPRRELIAPSSGAPCAVGHRGSRPPRSPRRR
jgi:WS/DGAT/MGAT family acyltransferase